MQRTPPELVNVQLGRIVSLQIPLEYAQKDFTAVKHQRNPNLVLRVLGLILRGLQVRSRALNVRKLPPPFPLAQQVKRTVGASQVSTLWVLIVSNALTDWNATISL